VDRDAVHRRVPRPADHRAIGAGVGGLQPALAVLAVATLVVAGVTVVALRRHTQPLNVSAP
jgi:hypothetical protein